MIKLLMKIQIMELQHIKQIQDQTIYNLSYLKLSSLFFLLILILGCESSKIQSIKIDEDLYLAPGPKNDKGCTQFSLMSKSGKPTNNALYTANKKGEYSMGQIKNCI